MSRFVVHVVVALAAACGSRDPAPAQRLDSRVPTSDAPEVAVDGTVIDAPWALDAAPDAQALDAEVGDAARVVARDAAVDARLRVADASTAGRDATMPPDDASVDAAIADVRDLGEPGEAVALVPVAGKVTVFDFWAPWCTPCKEVDRELTALAQAFPAVLAVRRVNVEDMDTPGAERHLVPGGFALPHLKVYNAAKQRVLEQSASAGGVAGLLAKVRAIVEAAP